MWRRREKTTTTATMNNNSNKQHDKNNCRTASVPKVYGTDWLKAKPAARIVRDHYMTLCDHYLSLVLSSLFLRLHTG